MRRCHTCGLIARRDAGQAPLWDAIYRSQYWDVVHSYNTSIPGWLVLVTRRHLTAVDEMNELEAIELGILTRQASIALKAVIGCAKTYVVQFAEAAEHPHVHFHLIPRRADLPAELRGPKIFSCLNVSPESRVSEDFMNEISLKLQPYLGR